MNKLSRSVTGLFMMGAAFVGEEVYRNDIIDEALEARHECYAEFEGTEATECADNETNYALLGLAEAATVIGGIACGVQAYRAIRDDER